jgi:hypothetical protein
MIRHLEAKPPQRGVNEDNVDAFAVLVEELDHLLVTAERAHAGRGVSLLELEIQANVSKELVLSRFLTRRGRISDDDRRAWVKISRFTREILRRRCRGVQPIRRRIARGTAFPSVAWACRRTSSRRSGSPGAPPSGKLELAR